MAVNEKSSGFQSWTMRAEDAGFLSLVVKMCDFTILNHPLIHAAGECLAALSRLQGKKPGKCNFRPDHGYANTVLVGWV